MQREHGQMWVETVDCDQCDAAAVVLRVYTDHRDDPQRFLPLDGVRPRKEG